MGQERLSALAVLSIEANVASKIKIIGRLECGRSQLEVSEELGINQSVISRLWQRIQDDDNVSRCYSTGRLRVPTPNEDRYLAVTKRNRRSTASDLSRQLSSATGTTVSRQTVYRRLGHIGLYTRRPVRYIPLTATHCLLRLTWSREHALWTPQQWFCVMFSDESRFSLQSDSRRTLIWRTPVTRYHQENTIERHRYGGAGSLVLGGIILGIRTDLYVQSVRMTGHIYRDVSLEQHVRLFRCAMGAEFLFMDDNARPHRANIVDECLQSKDITRMDWPAYSLDLNPIEHDTFQRLKKCLAVGFELITSNYQSLKQIVSLDRKRLGGQIGESLVIWVEAMRLLEDASKNGWTVADFGVMMVAFDLRPQQIERTDCLRLIERNLRSYRPLQLTPAHCRSRLQWCLTRSGWNHADWGCIVFIDESHFQLCPDNHRRRVWKRLGQRTDPAFIFHTRPQPGVMVWGAISFDSRTPLGVVRDTLTAQWFVDDILRTVLLPFLLQYLGPVFQQDNTRPHTACVPMKCVTAYQTLSWPARSPNLSPIEHI
ncbi:transposable element Tcb2 transposase [Trichonephila clavipes]|nr:transposable element Tcb2 transposase [Trichonephila clavipes]